jgi:hypothetical protein
LVPPAVNKVLTDMNIIGEAKPAELAQRARYDAKLLATAWVRRGAAKGFGLARAAVVVQANHAESSSDRDLI